MIGKSLKICILLLVLTLAGCSGSGDYEYGYSGFEFSCDFGNMRVSSSELPACDGRITLNDDCYIKDGVFWIKEDSEAVLESMMSEYVLGFNTWLGGVLGVLSYNDLRNGTRVSDSSRANIIEIKVSTEDAVTLMVNYVREATALIGRLPEKIGDFTLSEVKKHLQDYVDQFNSAPGEVTLSNSISGTVLLVYNTMLSVSMSCGEIPSDLAEISCNLLVLSHSLERSLFGDDTNSVQLTGISGVTPTSVTVTGNSVQKDGMEASCVISSSGLFFSPFKCSRTTALYGENDTSVTNLHGLSPDSPYLLCNYVYDYLTGTYAFSDIHSVRTMEVTFSNIIKTSVHSDLNRYDIAVKTNIIHGEDVWEQGVFFTSNAEKRLSGTAIDSDGTFSCTLVTAAGSDNPYRFFTPYVVIKGVTYTGPQSAIQ